MKQVDVVVGACFGDEGKGMVVDHLAQKSGSDALVIRFNGGAQAGHTVELPDGTRHVFHHFGSGTFQGAETFLSEFFIVNPLLFFKELETLEAKILVPPIFVDINAPLTVPYDIMINQIVERDRFHGGESHGSCGVGINETITRNQHKKYKTTVRPTSVDQLSQLLRDIRASYVPQRLAELGKDYLFDPNRDLIFDDNIVEGFINAYFGFLDLVRVTDFSEVRHDHVIFEGAQGLLLDEHHKWFPHVTRSRTGMVNVDALINKYRLPKPDVHYVTRCYLTRHGNGPLPFECSRPVFTKFKDLTNVPNEFQGVLRFAPLNLPLLADTVFSEYWNFDCWKSNLVVTCIDQIDDVDHFPFIDYDGKQQVGTFESVVELIDRAVIFTDICGSYSPIGNLQPLK